MMRVVISGIVVLCGLAVLMISSLGLFRFSTTLNRVHTARTDLLGATLVILGVIVLVGANALSLKLLAVLSVMWAVFPALAGSAAMAEIRAKGDLSDVCDILELTQDGALRSLGSERRASERRMPAEGFSGLDSVLAAAGGHRHTDDELPDLSEEILSLRRSAAGESDEQGVSE